MGDFPYFLYDPILYRKYAQNEPITTPVQDSAWRPADADPGLFMKSAQSSQPLLADAKKIIDTLATSKPYSTRLMNAARDSKMADVKSMIQKTGIQSMPEISFTPDGIHFEFKPKSSNNSRVVVALKWKEI